jgi:RNA polymerase sigma factor (sigma-70 family)
MSPERGLERVGDTSPRTFATTHWSVVLSAGQGPSTESDAALERLCRTYWWPLYAFVRRRGHEPPDAQDLTQEFFARLLAKDFLRAVDRSKGKFRSFLLAALEHFLANEWRRARSQKRGGGARLISLDDTSTENRYQQLPSSALPPERVFEQQWAMTLLAQAVSRLREEFVSAGKETLFSEIKIFLTGDKRAVSYAELASKLQTSEAALKMAVSRMKQRYGELLREEIGNTVSSPKEVEEELRALFAALSL